MAIENLYRQIADLRAELLERTLAHEEETIAMWIESGHMDFNLYGMPLPIKEREEVIETQCEGYGSASFWDWRNALKDKVTP